MFFEVDLLATIYSNTERPQRASSVTASSANQKSSGISIKGPLIFWIFFLILAVLLQVIVVPILKQNDFINMATTISSLASYIIYVPGLLIFPFLVSIWIGERVGSRIENTSKTMKIGFINAAYASLIYGITMFILFLILMAGQTVSFTQLGTIVNVIYLVFIPIPILLILTPSFAYLAAARRTSQ